MRVETGSESEVIKNVYKYLHYNFDYIIRSFSESIRLGIICYIKKNLDC